MKLIKIFKNPNFPQWLRIEFTDRFGFMHFVDEVQGRAMAIKVAKKVAKKEKVRHINVEGFIAKTEEL